MPLQGALWGNSTGTMKRPVVYAGRCVMSKAMKWDWREHRYGKKPEVRGVLGEALFQCRPGIIQDFMTSVRRQRSATRLVITHHSIVTCHIQRGNKWSFPHSSPQTNIGSAPQGQSSAAAYPVALSTGFPTPTASHRDTWTSIWWSLFPVASTCHTAKCRAASSPPWRLPPRKLFLTSSTLPKPSVRSQWRPSKAQGSGQGTS